MLFEKFCRFRYVLTTGLSDHSDEFFRRHPFPGSGGVLDVGCGFGETTLQIARQVGSRGRVLGVDCAPNFIDNARREAAAAAVRNAHYLVADVEAMIFRVRMTTPSPGSAPCSSTCPAKP